MVIIFAFLLFVSTISIHELGHALLMKRYNVQMKEICLFGVGPKITQFYWRTIFGNTPLTVRLIPLGAFVRTEDGAIENLEFYEESEHIFAGGVAFNFLYASLLGLVCSNLRKLVSYSSSSINNHCRMFSSR